MGVSVTGDGSHLRTAEAASALGVSKGSVINYARQGLLRTGWTVGGHRRITTESVRALQAVLDMPKGEGRAKALEDLRRRNGDPSGIAQQRES